VGRLVFVAGARPNFMKVAPILRAFTARRTPFSSQLVHTGQHYDAGLSQVFFDQLGIPAPDVHLGAGSGAHGAQTAKILAAFEAYLLAADPRPAGVVVVGDVNSTLAASLAAVKLGIRVAHVEAGLRSFDRTMPEEINRILTDAIADLLLVSEPSGEVNLRREGIQPERIRLVGNVMIDTLVHELSAARALDVPRAMGLAARPFVLVTLHRPSNVDAKESLERLVSFLGRLSGELDVVFPAHPRTRGRLEQHGLLERVQSCRGIRLVEPLGYRENLGLMAAARLAITDSGGIQEETSFLGVPCLTLRPNTERPVTVTDGTNTIVGADLARAEALVADVLGVRYKTGRPIALWDGHAAERVVEALLDRLG
jgi:UDP-N-acetylglucosamine 2-epimerase (non-hydrolysing)